MSNLQPLKVLNRTIKNFKSAILFFSFLSSRELGTSYKDEINIEHVAVAYSILQPHIDAQAVRTALTLMYLMGAGPVRGWGGWGGGLKFMTLAHAKPRYKVAN